MRQVTVAGKDNLLCKHERCIVRPVSQLAFKKVRVEVVGVANDLRKIFFGNGKIFGLIIGVKVNAAVHGRFEVAQGVNQLNQRRAVFDKLKAADKCLQSRNAVIDAEIVVKQRTQCCRRYQGLIEFVIVFRRQKCHDIRAVTFVKGRVIQRKCKLPVNVRTFRRMQRIEISRRTVKFFIEQQTFDIAHDFDIIRLIGRRRLNFFCRQVAHVVEVVRISVVRTHCVKMGKMFVLYTASASSSRYFSGKWSKPGNLLFRIYNKYIIKKNKKVKPPHKKKSPQL